MKYPARLGTPLTPSATKVMLLGSGELGKEVIISLQRLGVEVIAVDRYENAPGHQVAHRAHVINMTDGAALAALIEQEKPDLVVPEIEAIATPTLLELETAGKVTVVPTARAAWLTMNREGIRRLAAEELGLPTSPYRFADSLDELKAACEVVGFPCVVKPVMSSSGKGQSKLDGSNDVEAAWNYAASGGRVDAGRVIVEGFIDFDYEITQLTVRALDGEGKATTHFCEPIGHLQVKGDYVESWQPHPMHPAALQKAREISKKVTDNLGGLGIFGVELFVKNDMVWFSEVSPRPHDTGMVTMASQVQSEFELHAKAILGLPVNAALKSPAASAVIYGQYEAKGIAFDGVAEALQVPGADIRLFGKPESFERRRMGVALATADDVETARVRAKGSRSQSEASRRLMKFRLPRISETPTGAGIFRLTSLFVYASLLLYALATDIARSVALAIPALLLAVAVTRYLRPHTISRQWLLLTELVAAVSLVSGLVIQQALPGSLPWLLALAGIFPLVLNAVASLLVVTVISFTGATLDAAAGTPAFAWLPSLLVTLCAGLSAILLARTLHHGPEPRGKQRGVEHINHVAPYDDQPMHEKMGLNEALRSALERNELTLVYQPKVCVIDGSLKGFESLLRWNSRKYGDIPPIEFIPVAESSGLVIPIGLWVLEQACEQFARWQAQYQWACALTISVNVSMHQLLDPAFADAVAAVLRRTGITPRSVELELTESAAMISPARTMDNLIRLKKLGLRLALDDFGTGYSSLAHLQSLPVDVLKIDRAFVQRLDKNPSDLEIVRAILALAQTLNFETVAEGVETRENMMQLKRMGCYLAQGFVFSEAVNAEMAEDMLRSPRLFAVG